MKIDKFQERIADIEKKEAISELEKFKLVLQNEFNIIIDKLRIKIK